MKQIEAVLNQRLVWVLVALLFVWGFSKPVKAQNSNQTFVVWQVSWGDRPIAGFAIRTFAGGDLAACNAFADSEWRRTNNRHVCIPGGMYPSAGARH